MQPKQLRHLHHSRPINFMSHHSEHPTFANLPEPFDAPKIARQNDKTFCEPELSFTRDCCTISEQASRIERIYFKDDHPFGDSFLVFARRLQVLAPEGFYCDVRGLMWGFQIVAYRCDEKGVVESWSCRFEIEAYSYDLALAKLRYLITNDLIYKDNLEDIEC